MVDSPESDQIKFFRANLHLSIYPSAVSRFFHRPDGIWAIFFQSSFPILLSLNAFDLLGRLNFKYDIFSDQGPGKNLHCRRRNFVRFRLVGGSAEAIVIENRKLMMTLPWPLRKVNTNVRFFQCCTVASYQFSGVAFVLELIQKQVLGEHFYGPIALNISHRDQNPFSSGETVLSKIKRYQAAVPRHSRWESFREKNMEILHVNLHFHRANDSSHALWRQPSPMISYKQMPPKMAGKTASQAIPSSCSVS